jgi:hypothetical protein
MERVDDEEIVGLEGFKQWRHKERKCRREFQDLLDWREDVNDEHLYFMQLFARRHMGAKLTKERMFDLIEFERKETAATRDGEAAVVGAETLPKKSIYATTATNSHGLDIYDSIMDCIHSVQIKREVVLGVSLKSTVL